MTVKKTPRGRVHVRCWAYDEETMEYTIVVMVKSKRMHCDENMIPDPQEMFNRMDMLYTSQSISDLNGAD